MRDKNIFNSTQEIGKLHFNRTDLYPTERAVHQ